MGDESTPLQRALWFFEILLQTAKLCLGDFNSVVTAKRCGAFIISMLKELKEVKALCGCGWWGIGNAKSQ